MTCLYLPSPFCLTSLKPFNSKIWILPNRLDTNIYMKWYQTKAKARWNMIFDLWERLQQLDWGQHLYMGSLHNHWFWPLFFKEDLTLHYFLHGMFVCNSFLQHTIFLAILLLAKIKIKGFFFRISDLLCNTAKLVLKTSLILNVLSRNWEKYVYLENKRYKKFSQKTIFHLTIGARNACSTPTYD